MASSHTTTDSTVVAPQGGSFLDGPTMRGMATVSFCFGCWSSLVFWWYPYGLFVGMMAVILGVVTLALGVRAGLRRENLAFYGVLMGMNACGLAFACYRGVQFFFEGSSPFLP
jgi:hypothetical protein